MAVKLTERQRAALEIKFCMVLRTVAEYPQDSPGRLTDDDLEGFARTMVAAVERTLETP